MKPRRDEWRWYHAALILLLLPAWAYAWAGRRDLIEGNDAALIGILGAIFLLFLVVAGFKYLRPDTSDDSDERG